ncbi:MAG TPA: 50S ribosomal protein L21 [Cryomorphaceae bacterium]|jgi:large subunit ribosomal protein L21|nr:MAG: 50S ribosomal protein L21 [Cryomorphaceae bacterium BACL7 MAG-120910-bin2]KRO69056.1 MAG: 50S ribosomal protein L21 [Cryomorphaceae bacterium BACL7 MAG-120322-bin74]KRO84154.1 MAG: 50S ribosomal protein L21 [Cryomorphaceae bacterium BACL7 MAG-121220-bin83]HAB32264.1 50S ribosomal protein L21 [Cryomorphaceae bacterium]HAG49136.1 50S ribosomal protein L21 [Cryomorphaceae bacterium]
MYAIVEIAGLQYKVQKDQRVYVHRLEGNEGDKLTFDRVLLAEEKDEVTVGAPVIEGATVKASILAQVKADKVIIFKKKRRKGYEKKTGHRQPMTQILITDIRLSAPKKKATKKAEATEEVAAEA